MSQTQDDMQRHEYALLDVVRLALTGDSRSLQQRTRNLLRGGANPVLSSPARSELRRLLAGVEATEARRGVPAPLSTGVAQEPQPVSIKDAERPALETTVEANVEQLIREHEQRHLLEESNLSPTTRVLLTGPPGTGKTMTAHWIAYRLRLPLLVIEPGQILTSLMGESARNLSALMHRATLRPGVLLLDELDAYARDRGDGNDIAEPKRLVNTLLLELDRWPEHSLLIAGSNHDDVLDLAVRRRFESTLTFGFPGVAARRQILADVLARARHSIPDEILDAIAAATSSQSGSTLTHTAVAALRRSILDHVEPTDAVCQQFFASRFIGRDAVSGEARRQFVGVLSDVGYTPVRLAELTLSNVGTVRSLLGESPL